MVKTAKTKRGRPSKVREIEDRLGMGIEHHVAVEMARGRTSRQIAAALRIGTRTLRYHLRSRGYKVECDCRLVKTGPCEQGGG